MAERKLPWSAPQIIWSALFAIVVWSAVGFSWFGVGFDWMTQGSAKQLSTKAVTESLATICVAQAQAAPDAESALQQFKDLQTWKQREFIETARWAIMPGSESSQSGVAELCATKLRQT
ncbi:MAG: hypothetical protein OEQ18_07415 [Gammaproteobacteria bacterium]|nr:hypothetical protein [Gammaproteobacteria bacterium]